MNEMRVTRPQRLRRASALTGAAALLSLMLAACGGGKENAAPAGAGGPPPPPEVSVVTVQPGTVDLTVELPGRLEASRTAQVRARATGILQKRAFTEGSDVKAGQTLYKVDAAPYDAALQSAQAQLAQAQAQLAQTSLTAKRYKPLVAANAVSQQEYDNAAAAEKAAQAQVAAGKAAVRTARINLDYTTVKAPIAGRIGRSLVTEGALVSQQEGTHLATIQQVDPLYINLSQPAADVLRQREALDAGQIERAGKDEAARVDVLLENGEAYGHAGRLLFTDLSVDPSTGQVNLRAEVPNPEGLLLPGMYVRVHLQQARISNAILLPQQAVTRDSRGNTVIVVAEDGSIAPRPVTIAGSQKGQWIVTDGLKPGEQVMVEGAMKLMFGASVVKPMPWRAAGQDPAASEGGPQQPPAAEAPSDGANAR